MAADYISMPAIQSYGVDINRFYFIFQVYSSYSVVLYQPTLIYFISLYPLQIQGEKCYFFMENNYVESGDQNKLEDYL